jgi:hypothetical protein
MKSKIFSQSNEGFVDVVKDLAVFLGLQVLVENEFVKACCWGDLKLCTELFIGVGGSRNCQVGRDGSGVSVDNLCGSTGFSINLSNVLLSL